MCKRRRQHQEHRPPKAHCPTATPPPPLGGASGVVTAITAVAAMLVGRPSLAVTLTSYVPAGLALGHEKAPVAALNEALVGTPVAA